MSLMEGPGKQFKQSKKIMKTKVFIQDLKCGGCAKTIETVLNAIGGVDLFGDKHLLIRHM